MTAELILTLTNQATTAQHWLRQVDTTTKNQILQSMADMLLKNESKIIAANQRDLDLAHKKNLSAALIDRLVIDKSRLLQMATGVSQIAQLTDPIGEIIDQFTHANGLTIIKQRAPIGVIAMIYEARPNVTADVAALCLKTSNAVILRGGKEALHTNRAIYDALIQAGEKYALPAGVIQLLDQPDHELVQQLIRQDKSIDLIIPRGGERLIKAISENATVPVIKHYKGLCHTYVDADANIKMALAICINAKCQRPGVCNAMETLLVNKQIAAELLPQLAAQYQQAGVEMRGDRAACALLSSCALASEQDWDTEYLDLIISIRIVDDIQQAIAHINQHGSHHSDAIISNDPQAQQLFQQQVDSAVVYVNASTRFTDGYEFGMGAEIGISTDKLHARGPMGLKELTTYRYLVKGDGQIRT